MAEYLPTEELDAIRELFHMLDTNKKGHLTVEELRKGLQMIGHNVHDTDVDMLMEAVRSSSLMLWLLHLSFYHLQVAALVHGIHVQSHQTIKPFNQCMIIRACNLVNNSNDY